VALSNGSETKRCVLITIIFNIKLEKVILSAQDNNLGTSIGATQIDVVRFLDDPKPDRGSKEIIVVQNTRTL